MRSAVLASPPSVSLDDLRPLVIARRHFGRRARLNLTLLFEDFDHLHMKVSSSIANKKTFVTVSAWYPQK